MEKLNDTDLRKTMLCPKSFHIVVKPVGPRCNLNCEYCYYLEKTKYFPEDKNSIMPKNILEEFIRQYIGSQDVPVITFSWQGGEPSLAGLDFYKNVVNLQKKYSAGKKIENSFQTNGILLDDRWCDFFSENNFLIGLSIDGPREIQDKYRVYKNGKSTFDDVMKSLKCLKKHQVEFNTLTCVQKDNSYKPLEVYNFLKEIGSRFMQFIPIVERKVSYLKNNEQKPADISSHEVVFVTNWSVESLQYGKFMKSIFDTWVKNDVGNYFVQLFDVCLGIFCGYEPGLCIFGETCGRTLVLEHNGDVYSCDHFVYPENLIQNIIKEPLLKIVNSEKQIKFGIDKKEQLPDYCRECDVSFICNGECPKNIFIKTPGGEEKLNYLCEGYKYFFRSVSPYMRFMANEIKNHRPPANVMKYANENFR